MKEFEFKPIDHEGEDTLKTIAQADQFNRWMYDTIKPFCKGNILEIGSGLGNISSFFLADNAQIFLSDIRESYCQELHEKFLDNKTLLGIETMNLVDPEFDTKFHSHFGQFDTVFSLNVLEHIFDDHSALNNCYKLLKPGGHVIILVPAYQWLYNTFDKELEHYRRYNRKQLEYKLLKSNFSVLHSQYYNAAGMAGWFVSGKMQRNKTIPGGQIRLYNRLVTLFKIFDKMVFQTFGLSVITVGIKDEHSGQ